MRTAKSMKVLVCGAAVAALAAMGVTRDAALAQQGGAASPAALTGVVSSQEEGEMEGVVVTARRSGANFDVSVVSDAQGKYTFPRSHMQPGTYALKMRAVGYDLVDPGPAEVTGGKTATLDLKLQKTKDITRQLTSVEWLMSEPGTDAQKAMVIKQMQSCTYCHNLELPFKSKHTAAEFVPLITRMQAYWPDGTSYAIYEGRGRRVLGSVDAAAKNPGWGFWPNVQKTELAAYLASVNQSGGKSLPKEFKTLPRPTGKATRVIITQYDMPRKDTVAHDSDVDSQGRLWYADQSAPFLGVWDPKTGAITEYPMPVSKKHAFTGGSDVQVDKDDNVWMPITHESVRGQFGLLHKFDTKTKKFIPSKMATDLGYQFLAMAPGPNSDGKIWAGFGEFGRVDSKTLEMDWRFNWIRSPKLPKGPKGIGYGIAVDPKGNPWLMDYAASGLTRVDVNTKEITFYSTPTPNSGPRRGVFDTQGRLWFGEYAGDKMGMFDSTTGKFTEFDPGIKWFAPYTASNSDKYGRAYAPSHSSDRLMRADSRTGEVVVYLMPTQDFDAKQIRIDPVSGTAVLFANKRNARVVKVEPLD
jgi:virginiamycin B lyase